MLKERNLRFGTGSIHHPLIWQQRPYLSCVEPQLIRFLDRSLSQMDNEIQLEIFKKQYKMQTDLVHFQMLANWTQ